MQCGPCQVIAPTEQWNSTHCSTHWPAIRPICYPVLLAATVPFSVRLSAWFCIPVLTCIHCPSPCPDILLVLYPCVSSIHYYSANMLSPWICTLYSVYVLFLPLPSYPTGFCSTVPPLAQLSTGFCILVLPVSAVPPTRPVVLTTVSSHSRKCPGTN